MKHLLRLALLCAALAVPSGWVMADDEAETEEPKPTVEELLHQLEGERTEILEELAALEEGYSELADDDREPSETSMKGRLDGLLGRLDDLDRRIADLKSRSKKRQPSDIPGR